MLSNIMVRVPSHTLRQLNVYVVLSQDAREVPPNAFGVLDNSANYTVRSHDDYGRLTRYLVGLVRLAFIVRHRIRRLRRCPCFFLVSMFIVLCGRAIW